MSSSNLVKFGTYPFKLALVSIWDPLKQRKKCLLFNNSAAHLPIVLKFGRLVHRKSSYPPLIKKLFRQMTSKTHCLFTPSRTKAYQSTTFSQKPRAQLVATN